MYFAVAADTLPISYGVRKAANAAEPMVFDIQSINRDSSAVVVDVSGLFTSDMAESGSPGPYATGTRCGDSIPRRSSKVKPFPDNIEMEATMTYDAGQVPRTIRSAP